MGMLRDVRGNVPEGEMGIAAPLALDVTFEEDAIGVKAVESGTLGDLEGAMR